MNSRDLVRKTLDFSGPQRIPRQLWLLPWAGNHYPEKLSQIQQRFPDDIIFPPLFCRKPLPTSGSTFEVGTYVDEWGCIFENGQAGVIGQVKEPIVRGWQDMDKLRVPEELLTVDVNKVNEFCRNTDKFILSGCCPRPFERLQFIRGTENVYLDLAMQPDELKVLLDKIHQFNLKELEIWAKTDVDALFVMDDWGSQKALLISPELWRKLFKPLYKQYADIAHDHNKYMFMHSDGCIIDIIPDLIETGIDALNSQLFCMEVEPIGTRFKGKITFWGEIDRQYILPYGSTNDVYDAVCKVKDCLYSNGGVIAQCEFGPGANPENVCCVFESWEQLGSMCEYPQNNSVEIIR